MNEKMRKGLQHIIVLTVLLFSIGQCMAQISMPDTVCVGVPRIYQVNDATVPSTYTWKIDGTTQTSSKNQIGISWVKAGTFLLSVQEHSAGGCDGDIRSGLVYVIAPPPATANAGPDTVVCFGNPLRLSGGGGVAYQWSPSTYLSNAGIAYPVATIPLAGNYQYILHVNNNNGCGFSASDTVIITVLPSLKIFAGKDTAIAINQPLQLNVTDNNNGFINYTWVPLFGLTNPFIKNPVAILNRDITYTVTAQTAKGCVAKDDINVKVYLGPEIYVPTAFTPNKDGLNDFLEPILVGIKALRYFAIYNRYGEQVYKTTVQGEGWNGIINGKMQNTGAYVWVAEAEDYKGNIISRKGMAVLVK